MKRLSLLVLLGACGGDVPPFVGYDNLATLRAALAPNATLVTVAPDVSSERNLTSSHDLQGRVKVQPLSDGFVAVLAASREDKIWNDELRTLGLVRGGSGGTHTLEVAAARSMIISFGDEALVITCNGAGVDHAYLSDAGQGFVELAGVPETCARYVSGRAVNADEALVVLAGGTVRRWTLDRGDVSVNVDDFEPAPLDVPAADALLFVDEPAAGDLAMTSRDADTLTYTRGAVTATTTDVTALSGQVDVSRGDDGALRVATPDGLWRWDADTSAVPEKLAEVPSPVAGEWQSFAAPGGAYSWVAEPNPSNPAELYPTAASIRLQSDDTFTSFTPPATPCCDPAACRQAAESYVIGAFGEGAARVTFYDLWTWVGTNEHAMVVAGAPLDCGP